VELANYLGKLTIFVFDLMSLVYDNVVPLDLLQTVETQSHSFETGDQNIEFPFIDNGAQDLLPFIAGGYKFDNPGAGHPFLELVHPVAEGDLGGDDDVRATYLFILLNKT
jgi:hypothetical protein